MAAKPKKEDPTSILIERVRLSFAQSLFEAEEFGGEEGEDKKKRHQCRGLMEKGTELTKKNLAKIKAAKELACKKQKQWGDDPKKWPKLKASMLCVRDGDEENWDGYPDHWYIAASCEEGEPLLLIDRHKNDVTKKDGLLYSGAYVNLRVRIWAQDNKWGKRINAQLQGVQFVEHGEPFGGNIPLDRESAFEDLSEDGDVEPMEPSMVDDEGVI